MACFAMTRPLHSPALFAVACCLLIGNSPSLALSAEPVKAELGKESAWAGEPVPLIITLYSVGPFSGTAAFELPELPLTNIVRGGSPTVGSETMDGESYLTQRHELSVFTQRTGQIAIPPISVRFSGKESFTSEPKLVEAQTTELTFESKRPDVPTELGVVVAASTLKISETWTPDSTTELTTGDVVKRIVRREASDTTAMMMPALDASAPSGVRVYISDPVVRDRSNRGTVTAEREDTIKYQFEQPGTFTIPSITVSWWDTKSASLERGTLPERTFHVQGEIVAERSPQVETANTNVRWIIAAFSCLLTAVAGLMLSRRIKPRLLSEERKASRKVLAACASNDAAEAYASLLLWKRALEAETASSAKKGSVAKKGSNPNSRNGPKGASHYWGRPPFSDSFHEQLQALTRHLYDDSEPRSVWSGEEFSRSFRTYRRRVLRTDSDRVGPPDLPSLNPT